MLSVNPHPASVRAYPPSLYLPGSYGRLRQYPRVVKTPIPGAGYRVGKMVWGEQVLDLDGSRRPYPYGQYPSVPLRGLGQAASGACESASPSNQTTVGFVKKVIASWGAWPNPACPKWLWLSGPVAASGDAMLTDDALKYLKYQAVAFGVIGVGIGMMIRRRQVKANRRRGRR